MSLVEERLDCLHIGGAMQSSDVQTGEKMTYRIGLNYREFGVTAIDPQHI